MFDAESPKRDAPLPGPVGGRYRLAALLPGAGMSMAYRGWDDASGAPVVVKMPRQRTASDDGFGPRFNREIQTLTSLAHPHIVPVLDHGLDQGFPYLVMPLLGGGSLAARQGNGSRESRQPTEPASLHDWLPAIAAALDAAHGQGVLHRDVKPANIFFDGHGTAFLGDFGIAKIQEDGGDAPSGDDLTRTNIAIGTECYMAPERFQPRPNIDGRSDQYSLAVTVYEVLAGRRPFQGDTAHIVVEHCTAAVPPLTLTAARQIPLSLWSAIEKALGKTPDSRFDTCEAFAAAALADVPRALTVANQLSLICPACQSLIRIPRDAAGRRGTCRQCRTPLSIAVDGSWLLPAEENPSAEQHPIPAEEGVEAWPRVAEPSPPPGSKRPRSDVGWLPWAGGVTALAGLALLVGWRVAARPSSNHRVAPAQLMLQRTDDEEPSPVSPEPVGEQRAAVESVPEQPLAGAAHSSQPIPVPGPSPSGQAGPPAALPPLPAPAPLTMPDEGRPPAPATVMMVDEPGQPARPAEPPPEPAPDPGPGLVEEMHWVLVDDPGNLPDENGLGAVAHAFFLGRYEVTNAEYCAFLNGSTAGSSNLHGVGDVARQLPEDAPADADAGFVRHGNQGEYRYVVSELLADKPVTGLRWCDAARMANWLHNGGGAGADTEHGAYELANGDLTEVEALSRSANAQVWIPTRDEWYKAAYFKGDATDAGYWRYPTCTTSALPVACGADQDGVGIPGEDTKRSANFAKKSRWCDDLAIGDGGCVTSVGSNGGPGPYGTYDMGGNAAELVTIEGLDQGSPRIGLCGGDAGSAAVAALEATAQAQLDELKSPRGGFRLARAATDDVNVRDPLDYSRPPGLTLQAKRCLLLIQQEIQSLLRNEYQPHPDTLRKIQNVRDRLFLPEALPLRAKGVTILLKAHAATKERDAALRTVDGLTQVGSRGPLASLIGPAAAADRERIVTAYSSDMAALRPEAEKLAGEIAAMLAQEANQ